MKQLSWRTCIRAGSTAALTCLVCTCRHSLLNLAGMLLKAGAPLLLGGCIAYVTNILMSCYERRIFGSGGGPVLQRLRRPLCLLLALGSVMAAAAWMIQTVIPELLRCVNMLLASLPGTLCSMFAQLERGIPFGALPEGMNLLPGDAFDWAGAVTRAIALALKGVGGVMDAAAAAVTAMLSTAATLMLALVFAGYLLAGKERLGAQCRRLAQAYLGRTVSRRVFDVLETLDDVFRSYIVGQCMEALILGALCFLGMMVLGMPQALTISVMVGFMTMIPMAGGMLATAAGAAMLLTDSPATALLFAVFLTVLQQLEGNLIFPRVVGSSIGLPAVWMLPAVTLGGGLLGVSGMLLGVPLAAVLYRLLGRDLRMRERSAEN